MAGRKKLPGDREIVSKVMQTFGVVIRPVSRLRKNPQRALATPQTTVDKLKKDVGDEIEGEFRDMSPEVFLSRMLEIIPEDINPENIEVLARAMLDEQRAALCKDALGAQLLALYDAADLAGLVVPFRLGAGPLDAEVVDVWSVTSRKTEMLKLRGERRWLALRDLMLDLLEKVYKRYLRSIWALSFLACS